MDASNDRVPARPLDDIDHLRLIADWSADALFHVDVDGVLRWVSPAIERLLGWRPEELLGTTSLGLLIADDRHLVPQVVPRLQEGEHSRFEARLRTAAGPPRWVSVALAPVMDHDTRMVGCVGSLRDIDDDIARLAAEQARGDRLREALDSMHDPHVVLEAVRGDADELIDFVLVHVNDAACEFSRMRREDLVGRTLLQTLPSTAAATLLEMYRRVVDAGEPLVLDDFAFPVRTRDGEEHHFDVRATRVGDGVSHTWRDVSDRHRAQEILFDRATHDALTGLANRSRLAEELDRALGVAHGAPHLLAVLLVDVDRFKEVNDTFGHAVGDELLRVAARRLEVGCRAGDLVARLGGDEFLVVMPRVDEPDEAVAAAERLVRRFREPIDLVGQRMHLTLSVGVALATGDEPVDEVLRRADVALYAAKGAGRDRVELYMEGSDPLAASVG